jgi:hypothetical protein
MSTTHLLTLLPAAVLGVLIVGCERLPPPDGEPRGEPLSFNELTDTIPLEYGRLVTITPRGEHGAVLWFERPDQAVVAVRVNISHGGMSRTTVTFPRR